MRLKNFDYNLPRELIAQQPVKPRDQSRLLVFDRKTGRIEHKHFYDVVNYLNKGDVLVLNNTKVMPARLIGKKAETGGRVEVFLLRKACPPPDKGELEGVLRQKNVTPLNPPLSGGRAEVWQCLVGGKKRKENLKVEFAGGLKAEISENNQDGTWNVKFNKSGAAFMKIVEKIGQVPLPPYIKRTALKKALVGGKDCKSYQTVYADETKSGSVAAPTAGLHFTKLLINKLKKKGVQFEYVTLRVGLGTFAPVKVDDITKHKMHAEWIEISKNILRNIIKAKLEGRRIIAVGTTSVRALESVFCSKAILERSSASWRKRAIESDLKKRERDPIGRSSFASSRTTGYSAWTDIFIYPGYKFKAVNAMITNFHLPKSTLIMLVSAFAKASADKSALVGRKKIFKAYQAAIKKKYRFYSYGDAMLII